ncbi:MAG: NAD(P)-dependent alcohol dehydrogenase [Sphingobacteriales bacterium]|nr:NAD(P)-dependent alcohol dehydrogenase [Sphingobacteriales bacterium]
MKAITYHHYGSADVLQLEELEKPIPKADEVLIKIKASTVNRTDCGFRNPEFQFIKLISGITAPKAKVLGSEFAGIIEAIGDKVTRYKVGDKVFGLSTYTFGTHTEYICKNENNSMAIMPNNYSFEEAAAVCDGLMLAYANIRKIDFSTPKNILINGATGAIGISALQLVKYFGATVTAVGNTKNLELLKSLGADKVIDYTAEDFTKTNEKYDVVFDAVGKSTFFKCIKLLKPKGVYFSTELGPYAQNIPLALFSPWFNGRQLKFPIPKDSREDIEFFKMIIEEGKYKAIIDRTYTLEQVPDAHRYVELGEKTGNVVIHN